MKSINELLRYHIDKNGYTVYSISYQCQINRTTLQKCLSGQRKLTQEIFDNLLPFFQLTSEEESELKQAFLINQIGEERYKCHMYVKKLLESPYLGIGKNISTPDTIAYTNVDMPEIFMVNDKIRIINMLCFISKTSCDSYENPYLFTCIDFSDSFVTSLEKMMNDTLFDSLTVKHLTTFKQIDKSLDNYSNLTSLTNIIQVVFMRNTAQIFYHYVVPGADMKEAAIFPYYMITNEYVILISKKYDSAAFIKNKDLHGHYLAQYESLLNTSKLLTGGCMSDIELLMYLLNNDDGPIVGHCMEPQPTLEMFITEDMINKYASPEIAKAVMPMLNARISQLKELPFHITFFIREGLKLFAEEGKFVNISDKVAGRPDICDRIEILEKLKELNLKEKLFLMINDSQFNASANFALVPSFPDKIIMLFYLPDGNIQAMLLTEPSLFKILIDFFGNIETYNYACTFEETNAAIQGFIDELKSKIE